MHMFNQLVAEWRDISKMVATGKKLSDNEMRDGKMYSAPKLFGTGAAGRSVFDSPVSAPPPAPSEGLGPPV